MAFGKDTQETTSADIEKQVEQLRKDIAALTASVTSITASKAEELKGRARKAGNDVADISANVLESARGQVVTLEKDVENHIRSNPLQSIGIAAGIGFLAALLVRRG